MELSEACGTSVLEHQIAATRSQYENLRTAVLVDENLTRARFLGLRHQEIDDDRLAAPGRANDQRVANVALVNAEEVGAACARLHQRDRVHPMVHRGEASGLGLEGRELSDVQRSDRLRPRAPSEVSDDLAHISGFTTPPSRCP